MNSSWSLVSTPSPTTRMPRRCAMAMIASTTTASPGSRETLMDERLVDLDGVHRELFQVAEAGIARTEVVEGQTNAQSVQRVQCRAGLLQVAHQATLRDLQLETVRRHGVTLQRLRDRVHQPFGAQLAGRDVDRNRHLGVAGTAPSAELATGGVEDPSSDRKDEAGIFGQRHESLRWEQAEILIAPAKKRLRA